MGKLPEKPLIRAMQSESATDQTRTFGTCQSAGLFGARVESRRAASAGGMGDGT
jgi:hypothetical protein